MLIVRDYQCNHCGYKFETIRDNSLPSPQCHECGGETRSIISGTSFRLEGTSGDFPGAHMKWEKKRQQKMEHEQSQGITAFGEPDL
jgi:putative FmdB family regulatory protein